MMHAHVPSFKARWVVEMERLSDNRRLNDAAVAGLCKLVAAGDGTTTMQSAVQPDRNRR